MPPPRWPPCKPARACRAAASIALCDFGGSGTTLALADAGQGLPPIGEVVRHGEFSGEQIDQAILSHVLAGVCRRRRSDPAGTAAVGSLTALAWRMPAGQGTAVGRDHHGHPGATARIHLRCAVDPRRIGAPDRRTAAGFLDALGDRVGAQQNSGRQPGRGGHCRRRRGDSAAHPAAFGTAARAGGDDARPADWPPPPAPRCSPNEARPRTPRPGWRRRPTLLICRPVWLRQPGRPVPPARRPAIRLRRFAVGDVPRLGVVAG